MLVLAVARRSEFCQMKSGNILGKHSKRPTWCDLDELPSMRRQFKRLASDSEGSPINCKDQKLKVSLQKMFSNHLQILKFNFSSAFFNFLKNFFTIPSKTTVKTIQFGNSLNLEIDFGFNHSSSLLPERRLPNFGIQDQEY